MLTRITATNTASGNTNVQVVAATTGLRLMGYSIQESSGTPAVATLTIRHGTANTDTVVVYGKFAASESKTEWFGPQGIPVSSGVYLERITGNTTTSIWTATVPGT